MEIFYFVLSMCCIRALFNPRKYFFDETLLFYFIEAVQKFSISLQEIEQLRKYKLYLLINIGHVYVGEYL